MSRPRKPRRVGLLPDVRYFKPQGTPMREPKEVQLSLDELEALRLKDLEELDQEESARRMGVSRPTFQRVLDQAHFKVAEALVDGKALRIEGGDYQVVPSRFHCPGCGHGWEQVMSSRASVTCPHCHKAAANESESGRVDPLYAMASTSRAQIREALAKGDRMKIAAVSDDGKTICAHFGRAKQYVVLTVEGGRVVEREVRDRSSQLRIVHPQGDGELHQHIHGHGHDHNAMAAAIKDCTIVLAGGMGRPAYASLKANGLEPVITDIVDIDEAVQAFISGAMENHTERLH
ncbi:MAG TPA: DUF134 domain-containing protein [Chloroflexota bacterium]|nr:DUF134 domain-containing protein [Chloroflexota bacterium]